MALNGKILSSLVFDAMAAADAKTAPIIDGKKVLTNTTQKQRERKAQADAIAITIIDYLVANTEVVIPDHPPAVAMTGVVPGPGPHAHTTNQPPIPHIIGEIK